MIRCETCAGTGKTPDYKQMAGWKYWSTYWCPDCKGMGEAQPVNTAEQLKEDGK